MVASSSQEVTHSTPQFSTENYKAITSFDDAVSLVTASQGALLSAEELGDGFVLMEDDKDVRTLVGVPMVILSVVFNEGNYGQRCIVRAVTKDGRKVVFVDGSTGLHAQLREFADQNKGLWPTLWPHGLRASDYKYNPETGRATTKDDPAGVPATTFYLDTSA